MFLTQAELKTVMYEYQQFQITENDDTIIETAIATAIEEVRSYLSPSNKKEWADGRLKYDITAIFSATGNNRNTLILEHTKNVAVWYLIGLSNVDMIYEQAKERYDRTIKYLSQVQSGDVTLSTLPTIAEETVQKDYYRSGSRLKFNWE